MLPGVTGAKSAVSARLLCPKSAQGLIRETVGEVYNSFLRLTI